jgi:hypothetical protein
MLQREDETGQPWRSACLGSLEVSFINILFCVYMSSLAFNNIPGIFPDFKILYKICLCVL